MWNLAKYILLSLKILAFLHNQVTQNVAGNTQMLNGHAHISPVKSLKTTQLYSYQLRKDMANIWELTNGICMKQNNLNDAMEKFNKFQKKQVINYSIHINLLQSFTSNLIMV